MKRCICFDTRWKVFWHSDSHRSVREQKVQSMLWMLLLLILIAALTACGGGTSSNEGPPSEVSPNQAPSFTSEANVSVPENTMTLIPVTASDADGDPITYRIMGGNDADQFHIDSQTGELSFKVVPDFDAPTDNNANNTYLVTVEASDGVNTARQSLVVSVTGVGLTVNVAPGHIKTLAFSWVAIPGVTHYKLYVNPNGVSGYTQVGRDIAATHTEVPIPAVHLTDWVNSLYILEGYDEHGLISRSDAVDITSLMLDTIGYIKASNAEAGDWFGMRIALSGDGNTLAVGAGSEDSAATGVDGDQDDNTAFIAGAVYVFSRVDGVWAQQAYIKASNTEAGDRFGWSIALNGDGNTLAAGASWEDSAATGVDGDQEDNTAPGASAVYVFSRVNGVWAQQAYIKASNAEEFNMFGISIALNGDGNTLAVGAPLEHSAATGVDGDQHDNTAPWAGAVYVFSRVDGVWAQQAYIKASNAEEDDEFGDSVALSGDGNTLAAGASWEDSAATGVDGDQHDNTAPLAGAVYIY